MFTAQVGHANLYLLFDKLSEVMLCKWDWVGRKIPCRERLILTVAVVRNSVYISLLSGYSLSLMK